MISSPVGLIVQLYLGTSAASANKADPAFLSSIVVAAGLVPKIELASKISLNQVVTVPISSRVPGMVGWSELGNVTNLDLDDHKRQEQFRLACSSGLYPACRATTIGCCQAGRTRRQQCCRQAENNFMNSLLICMEPLDRFN